MVWFGWVYCAFVWGIDLLFRFLCFRGGLPFIAVWLLDVFGWYLDNLFLFIFSFFILLLLWIINCGFGVAGLCFCGLGGLFCDLVVLLGCVFGGGFFGVLFRVWILGGFSFSRQFRDG